MSGIFGFIQKSGSAANAEVALSSMLAWNQAYGKDGNEILVRDSFGLGCCFEHFSDETLPNMSIQQSENTYVVIDALLYNRDELLKKCEKKISLSDEALLFSYITKFGLRALKDVNGDFCGAIYNNVENTLTLFRDHMGVRPLFYFDNDEFIFYSSDIRGLTALSQVDISIREEWVYKTLTGYANLTSTDTEFENIFCVKPASYRSFSCADAKLVATETVYWHLGSKKIRLSSLEAYQNRMCELITDAIKRRLDAIDGPIGAELSGGLDSSVIDILIHRLGRECIHFSWSADPAELPMADDDERLIIEDICKQENISCNYGKMKITLDKDSNIAHNMPTACQMSEDEAATLKYALPPYINALVICETSEFISHAGGKVIFTGHGGDEGVSHRSNPYEMFYNKEYYHFFKYIWTLTNGNRNRIFTTLKKSYKTIVKTGRQLKCPFQTVLNATDILQADFKEKFDAKKMPQLPFAFAPREYILNGGSRNRLDNVSILGAYCNVRYLIPYLDYRVIDFAVSIPRHLYLHAGINRYIFRETFKDLMPKSLYNLRCKEDNSRKNMTPNPDWYKEFAKRKQDIDAILVRDYWEKYLDFDKIDEWMKQGKPADEDRFHHENILYCLFQCAMVSNLINKSKSTNLKRKQSIFPGHE